MRAAIGWGWVLGCAGASMDEPGPVDSATDPTPTEETAPTGDTAAVDPLVRSTAAGALRGVEDGAAHAFLGIPYAAPPVGPRRFRPPEP